MSDDAADRAPSPEASSPASSSAASSSAASSGPAAPERRAEVDPRLLEFLVCPISKTSLDYDASRQELISRVARLAYPIRDGVPMMTVEAARHLDDEPGKRPPV